MTTLLPLGHLPARRVGWLAPHPSLTLTRIADWIKRELQMRYHQRQPEQPLEAHGSSVQRPVSEPTNATDS